MQRPNIHLSYACAILLTLFIGTVSVKWSEIKDLPGLISFAVGIASLILALIAIFQALTSGQSTSVTLSAIEQSSKTMLDLSNDLLPKIDQILHEHREGREDLSKLKALVQASNLQNTSFDQATSLIRSSASHRDHLGIHGPITNGATLPILCALWSLEAGRPFSTVEITAGDRYEIGYFDGVLGGLKASMKVDWEFTGGHFTMKDFAGDRADAEAKFVALAGNLTQSPRKLMQLRNILSLFPEKRSNFPEL